MNLDDMSRDVADGETVLDNEKMSQYCKFHSELNEQFLCYK